VSDDTRIPAGKRAYCSICGSAVWRSATSAAVQKCRPCRRANPAPRSVAKNPDGIEWACLWCGKRNFRPATRGQIPKYCDRRCAEALRSYERGEFMVTRARRRRLYERDGWTCQICGLSTSCEWSHGDPWSPTLDHIEPRSSALIPDDSDDNLRTAHWVCNQLRGASIRTDEEVRTLALSRR